MREFAREQGCVYFEQGQAGHRAHPAPLTRATSSPATCTSAPTPTPSPSARWAPSPAAWAPPISPSPWPPARSGCASRHPALHLPRPPQPLGGQQGPHPPHHRPDRHRRRPLRRDAVRGRGPARHVGGRPLHHDQHGRRGGRQGRHHARRRRSPWTTSGPSPSGSGPSTSRTPTPVRRHLRVRRLEDRDDGGAALQPRQRHPLARSRSRTSRSTRSFIGSCTNGRLEDLRRRPRSCGGRRWPPGCAASSSRPPRTSTWRPSRTGLARALHRGRLRLQHRHLRPLPGRLHGRPGRGRALREHQQPQLPRPHGPPQRARSTWRTRPWPPPPPSPGASCTRRR